MTTPENVRERWDAGEIAAWEYVNLAFDHATPETQEQWMQSMPDFIREFYREDRLRIGTADPKDLLTLRGGAFTHE